MNLSVDDLQIEYLLKGNSSDSRTLADGNGTFTLGLYGGTEL